MQAADLGAQVETRAMVRGCGRRDDKTSFELQREVAPARLDAEKVHAFGVAQLAVFTVGLLHDQTPTKVIL
ncbi:hypothetical protein BMI90_17585 [Thioclava sp. L04-15]|nr:hypothetical protein BMI90_17585 [Thioclava sp. L04-15]